MAEVDFSNAIIEPWEGVPSLGSTLDSWARVNPTWQDTVTLAKSTALLGVGGNTISTATITRLINEQKQLVYQYSGTFTASGTEFCFGYAVGGSIAAWRVRNISFSNGDTYNFTINATLTCN